MNCTYSQGWEFLCQVKPILERHDLDAFADHIRRFWPRESLVELLDCGLEDAVKVALLALSLTGTMLDSPVIARLLHHDDAQTVALADRALWSIWFRAGDELSTAALARAVRLMDAGKLAEAVAMLDALVHRDPELAEAYHQRAIAWFLLGDYRRAISDFKASLCRNQHHFGALASLGHSLVAVGELRRALAAYHRALAVHPRLEGIRQSIRHVSDCLNRDQSANLRPSPTV